TLRLADTQDFAFKPQAGATAIPSTPAPVTSPAATRPLATSSDDIFLITTFLLSFTTHVRSAEKFTGALRRWPPRKCTGVTTSRSQDYPEMMPAVTVENPLELPKVVAPLASERARSVKVITTAPQGLEGEGFPVRRAFAGIAQSDLDPFVHMDQMGEVDYGPGEPKGTPWHPHRGFETVTYMMEGTFLHQDSIGGGGVIENGATQWMTAGAGILHIERPPDALIDSGGLFHGVQLWVNLPARLKMTDPRYQDIEAQRVALLTNENGDAVIRVIAGAFGDTPGPGNTHTPISLVHVSLLPGARLALPWDPTYNALTYALAGQGTVGLE